MHKDNSDNTADLSKRCFALGRSISILHRFSQRYIDAALKDYRLNKAQMEILIILLKIESPLNQTRINYYFGYNKATITKLLNSLEKEGYIQRIKCETDRRERLVSLTQKGLELDQVFCRVLMREEKIFGEILGDAAGDPVRERLYVLAEALKDYDPSQLFAHGQC